MQNQWIFSKRDYLSVIDKRIRDAGNARGYRSLLAQAAGCQLAYLSQVLRGRVHLTPEHAAGLCDFWGFSEPEGEYFLTLVDIARSGVSTLTHRLTRKLERIRRGQEDPSAGAHHPDPGYDREKALLYYVDWVPSAIHQLLSVPGHNTAPELAKKLRLDEASVLMALNTLEQLGITKCVKDKWTLTNRMIHASDESIFAHQHHRNWREKALERSRLGRVKPNLHYTAVASLDRKSFLKIREVLTSAKQTATDTILPAKEEIVACLNIDWFEI